MTAAALLYLRGLFDESYFLVSSGFSGDTRKELERSAESTGRSLAGHGRRRGGFIVLAVSF